MTNFFDSLQNVDRQPFFDSLHDLPENVDDPNSPKQKELASIKEMRAKAEALAAHKKVTDWISKFHGEESDSIGDLRRQVDSGKLSGSDYYAMTGRIYSGSRGDSPGGGLHTGTMSTGGLDALSNFQSRTRSDSGVAPEGDAFMGGLGHPTTLPHSVAATVGPPTEGHAMAVDTLTYDTRLQTPTAQSTAGPAADGTRINQSPNERIAEATWKANQSNANAAVRANFRAAGLPDPNIAASVLNTGGGTAVVPGNLGKRQYPGIPSSIWG